MNATIVMVVVLIIMVVSGVAAYFLLYSGDEATPEVTADVSEVEDKEPVVEDDWYADLSEPSSQTVSKDMTWVPNKSQAPGSISLDSEEGNGHYCNSLAPDDWNCNSLPRKTRAEVIEICKNNARCKLIVERAHDGGATYWEMYPSEYASPNTWVDSQPKGGFTHGLLYYE